MKSRTPRLKLLVIIILLVIGVPLVLNQFYNYLLTPVSKQQSFKRFVIVPGQPFSQIAKNLEKEKLIRSALAFRLLTAQLGITNKIQPGDYSLPTNLSSQDLARLLTHGALDIWITFPEGQRIEQQAAIIDERLNTPDNNLYQFNKDQYIAAAQEGYMFPDTYLVSKEATASGVAEKLRGTFNNKVPRSLLLEGIKNNLTENEVVTLASIIERESRSNEERPIIAGILLNRLKEGMPLQVDATVQYAKGYDSGNNTWWPQVTIDDYKSVDSPYNTYLHTGLPPGPISNPGLESIRAAAGPANTPYLYYLHDTNGKIHYAKTGEQHNTNIQKYL
jgi:UPF0755 protein